MDVGCIYTELSPPCNLGVTATSGWDMRHQWRLKMLMTLYDLKILPGSIDILLHIYMSDSKLLIRSVADQWKAVSPKHMRWMWLEQASVFSRVLRFRSLEKMVENPKNPILTPQKWRDKFDHKIYTPCETSYHFVHENPKPLEILGFTPQKS